jgi:hypothetical protein
MNPHGIGFAWVENGRVEWSKGYDSDVFASAIEEFESKPYPKAVHFRYATHGGKEMDMTHPFNMTKLSKPTLTGRSNSVLFHNGVWTDYDGHILTGIMSGSIPKQVLQWEMSDSRAMAVLAGNFGERILDLVDLTGEKVLLLKGDGSSIRYGTWYSGTKEDDNDDMSAWWDKGIGKTESEKAGWYHSNMHLTEKAKKATRSGMTVVESREGNAIVLSETTKKSANSVLPKGSYLSGDYASVQEHIRVWGD